MNLGKQPEILVSWRGNPPASEAVAAIAAEHAERGVLTSAKMAAIYCDTARLLADQKVSVNQFSATASAVYKLGVISMNGDIVNDATQRGISTARWRNLSRDSLLRLARMILAASKIDVAVAISNDPSQPSLRLGDDCRPLTWVSDPYLSEGDRYLIDRHSASIAAMSATSDQSE